MAVCPGQLRPIQPRLAVLKSVAEAAVAPKVAKQAVKTASLGLKNTNKTYHSRKTLPPNHPPFSAPTKATLRFWQRPQQGKATPEHRSHRTRKRQRDPDLIGLFFDTRPQLQQPQLKCLEAHPRPETRT